MRYMTIDEWRAERIAEIDRFIRDYPFNMFGISIPHDFPRSADEWDESFCRYIKDVDVYRDTPDYEFVR